MRANAPECRFCAAPLTHEVVDLGMSPPCESFVAACDLDQAESFHPLRVLVCDQCWLVQLREYRQRRGDLRPRVCLLLVLLDQLGRARARLLRDDARPARSRAGSLVVELASNDGYLLQHFLPLGVPVLGIEPARQCRRKAIEIGVPTRVEFFGRELADRLVAEGQAADLIAGNNVLAQVPDLNDFVGGIARLLKPQGVATLEFPHLERLIAGNQFDTIYHEHFSYFSLVAVEKIVAAHGLRLFDVEELATHGGSLRVYFCRADAGYAGHRPRRRDLAP